MDNLFFLILYALSWLSSAVRVSLNGVLPPMSKLESQIFKELKSCIKDEYAEIFADQLRSINVVRNLSTGDAEIYFCYWSLSSLKLKYSGNFYFDRKKPKQKLAHIEVNTANGKKVKCILFGINGVISHLYFQIHATEYSSIRNSSKSEIKIRHGLITNNG